MTRKEAELFIKSLTKLRDSATDAQASQSVFIYPTLKETFALISAGTRINWKGSIKRAAVDLWDSPENNPDNAPDLWEDISYKEGYRVLSTQITAENTVKLDELCWYNGRLYKSLIDNNVWLPDAYPAGWEEVVYE